MAVKAANKLYLELYGQPEKENSLKSIYSNYNTNVYGSLTAEHLKAIYETLRYTTLSIPQIEASMKHVCSGYPEYHDCDEEELLDVLHEMDRRFFLTQDLQWEFSMLDKHGKGSITVKDAMFLFKMVHGEFFSRDRFDYLISNRLSKEYDVTFQEIEVELCDIPTYQWIEDQEDADRKLLEMERAKKQREEQEKMEMERAKEEEIRQAEEKRRAKEEEQNEQRRLEEEMVKKVEEDRLKELKLKEEDRLKYEKEERIKQEKEKLKLEEEKLKFEEEQKHEEEERLKIAEEQRQLLEDAEKRAEEERLKQKEAERLEEERLKQQEAERLEEERLKQKEAERLEEERHKEEENALVEKEKANAREKAQENWEKLKEKGVKDLLPSRLQKLKKMKQDQDLKEAEEDENNVEAISMAEYHAQEELLKAEEMLKSAASEEEHQNAKEAKERATAEALKNKEKRLKLQLRAATKLKNRPKLDVSIDEANESKIEALKPDIEKAEKVSDSLKCGEELEDAMVKRDLPLIEKVVDNIKNKGYENEHVVQVLEAEKLMDKLRRLERAKKDILELNQRTIAIIRSYSSPIPAIREVMVATYMILGYKEKELKEWKFIQGLLGRTGKASLKRMCTTLEASQVPLTVAKAAESKYLSNHTLESITDISAGIGTFYAWSTNIIEEARNWVEDSEFRKKIEEKRKMEMEETKKLQEARKSKALPNKGKEKDTEKVKRKPKSK